jgi:hypothetical protein
LVILAGEPRAVDDALVIVLGYAAWMIARLGRDWFRAAVSVAAGLALGACLGAVQWLPGLAAVSTSQRAGGSTALFDSGSLPVRWLLLGQRLQSRNILVLDLALAVLLAYWADQPAPAPRRRRGLPGVTRGRAWPETALGAIPAVAVAAVAVLGLTRGPALLHGLGIGLSRAASVSAQLRPSLIPYAVLGAAAVVLVIVMRRLGPRSRPRLLAGSSRWTWWSSPCCA